MSPYHYSSTSTLKCLSTFFLMLHSSIAFNIQQLNQYNNQNILVFNQNRQRQMQSIYTNTFQQQKQSTTKLKLSSSNNNNNNSNNNKNNNNNKNKNKNKIHKPQNEFSRPTRTDVILSPRSRRRQYNTEISANNDELNALAERFKLSKISKLDATLTLTQDSASKRGSRTGNYGGECVQVQGDVIAKVTQTCVRTNEDFDIELEFSIFSIVRPIESRETSSSDDSVGTEELGGMSLSQIKEQLGGGGGESRSNNKGKKKRRGGANSGRIDRGSTLDDFKIRELEGLLNEYDVEDDVFEDENVLGSDGILDVGELVAQMFRVKLDPYPKRPGSEPVNYSISG